MGINLALEAAELERQSTDADEAKNQKASRAIFTRAYHLTKPDLTERRLSKLYELVPGEVTIVKIKREHEFIPVTPDTTLQLGDRVTLVGYLDQLVGAWDALGPEIADEDLLDLPSESAQIVVHKLKPTGSRLGKLAISENYGCVLYLRSIRPTFGRVPAGVVWLFTELGLLIFMAGVGLKAGQTFLPTVQSVGPPLLVSGILVTCLPVIIAYLFGRYALKISPVLLMGGITGSMTSGASLKIVTSEAKSSIPALGYTGAYAFANVLLTIAGSLIMRI